MSLHEDPVVLSLTQRGGSTEHIPEETLVEPSRPRRIAFGVRMVGERFTGSFPMLNDSPSEMRILSTKTSCGCTLARTTEELLKPGEMTQLEFSIVFSSEGKRSYAINVVTDPDHEDMVFHVSGLVIKEAICPEEVEGEWDLGELDFGKVVRKYLRVGRELDLPNIEVSSEFEASFERISDSYVVLEIMPSRTLTPGPFRFRGRIGNQNVWLVGTLKSDMCISPPKISLRKTSPSVYYVTISSLSGSPFRLLAPDYMPPGSTGVSINIPTRGQARKNHRARIAFASDSCNVQEIVFKTDSPNRSVTLPVINRRARF